MNIFATDYDPVTCAEHHCDVHLRKMIVEVCQLLSTAHIVVDGKKVAYKKTHHNHPSGVWVRESVDNYNWTFKLLEAMLVEYEYRFDKPHKTKAHLKALRNAPTLPDTGPTPFAMAMPSELRSNDAHFSYRVYLWLKLKSWRERDKPISTAFTMRDVPEHLKNVSNRIIPWVRRPVVRANRIQVKVGIHYEPEN